MKKNKLVSRNSELRVIPTSFLLTNQKHYENSLKRINRHNIFWYSKVYYMISNKSIQWKSLKENWKYKRNVNGSKEDMIGHTIYNRPLNSSDHSQKFISQGFLQPLPTFKIFSFTSVFSYLLQIRKKYILTIQPKSLRSLKQKTTSSSYRKF